MKKLLILALLTALCLGCAAAPAEQKTTVLVYMCGTDLQEDACWDMYEMAMAETGDEVNLLVLAGGAEEWDLEDLAGGTRNLLVIRDGDLESLTDWGHASMGSGESLAEFLEYGLSRYPAGRNVVILWDHGAGSEGGVCFDETADDDGLTLTEIDAALRQVSGRVNGFHIDVFGCDACMMATYEMAAMLSHYDIDCYVASEELEPGGGWDYTAWLQEISENPGISNRELCAAIADSFMAAGLEENPDDFLTLSAVSLPKVRELEKSMEGFAAKMLSSVRAGDIAAIRRGRSRLYTFGSFDDGSWDMVDLGAMLDAYAQFDPENAAQARRCLAQAVIVNRQTDNLQPCSGLSILVPQDTVGEYATYSAGMDLSAYIPNWIGFVNGYADALQGGQHTFTVSEPQQAPQGTTFSGFFSSFFSLPGGSFSWDEHSESYTAAEEEGVDEITVSASEYGFTATLSAGDLACLDYVEGMLMMDVSDEEMTGYIDFGLMQNNLVDWETGEVYSLFDGTWPVFGDQLVPLYDQVSNARMRRSLIPVKVNGSYTYLVVQFADGGTEGRILGTNAGYDDSGLPIRKTTPLQEGDRIVPVYTMYLEDPENPDGEMEEMEFDGDEIVWKAGMTVTYEELGEDGEPMDALFCFVFNDIYGDYTMSEIVAFEI